VLTATITIITTLMMMMEAVSTSEMLVSFYETTWSNMSPENSRLHTCKLRITFYMSTTNEHGDSTEH
jgi:hypothetical protein